MIRAAATLLVALPLMAAAPKSTDWHLVDPKSGDCISIQAAKVGGPQSYIDYLRHTGQYGGQKILRAPDGSVAIVVVADKGEGIMEFYASHEICEIGKEYLVKKGALPGSPNELK